MAIKLQIGKVYVLHCGGVVRIIGRNGGSRSYFKCILLNLGFEWKNLGHYEPSDTHYWEDSMRGGVSWYWEDGMVDCRETDHPLNVVRELEP